MQEHYTDTIFYQIELTAKYCKLLGQQVFEQYNVDITVDEYSILDCLICNKNMCQRDLAKMILKDRANTGKLLDTLESKGLITRKLAIKNNRPVKIIEVTKEGRDKVEDAANKIRPNYLSIKEKIANSDLARVRDLLKELRDMLNDTLKIQI
ncbi:MarR family transcriptional regulator [bacterium]|nr:MarR family transcriptional regulator [bacterium]